MYPIKISEEKCHLKMEPDKAKFHEGRQQCLTCGKSISDRRNLVRHLRKIHCIEPVIKEPQLKCSFGEGCPYVCATTELLRDHLRKAHNFLVVKKVLNFKSMTGFKKWKQEEEESTNARYVAYTGSKFRSSKKIHYLRCHRSGVCRFLNDKTQRKRSKPSKGYTQCGATCPSSLKVSETISGSVQVIYYPIHLGHSLDDESIPFTKLSVSEKRKIAGECVVKVTSAFTAGVTGIRKLAKGEPVKKIVSDARKTEGVKLSRMNLLQRRDVYNIKKTINYLEKECGHDGKEIDAWVRMLKMGGLQHSPIVLYNPLNENRDYCLILIHNVQKIIYTLTFDGSIVYVKTKKGKPNVDFSLVVVSVISENGDSYPVAFCISNKTEYVTLYTFFKIIYQSFGVIRPQIFVSDNMSHYYLAWKNVMGESDHKLVCTFDIESYWAQKLSASKCPITKQHMVVNQLKTLLEQPDKDVFETELLKILKSWERHDDIKPFLKFFQKFYVNKKFEWATCYRIHSAREESINKYLEPINMLLDSVYEESYCSLSNSLNLIMFFVRDSCLLKILLWDEQAAKEKIRETAENHEEGSKLRQVKRTSESEWMVSERQCNYVIKKIKSECDKKCGIFCEPCDICIHNYYCVCNDYLSGFNICRHLHAVGNLSRKLKP